MEETKRKGVMKSGLLFVVLLLSAIEARSASFDCAKAATMVEKMICTDKELSKLDEDLQRLYNDAHKKDADPYLVKETQKKWIASRNTCKDRSCLAEAYRARIAALQKKLVEPAPCFRLLEYKWPEVNESSHKSVCVDVLRNLNKLCKSQPGFAWHPRHPMPIDPSIKTLSLPQWEELDPKEHVELIRYYFQYVNYFKHPEEQLREVPPGVLQQIKDGHTKLWHTWLDIDRDGLKEHLILFQYDPEEPGVIGNPDRLTVAVTDANLTQFDTRYEQIRRMCSIILYEEKPFFVSESGLARGAFSIAEGFTIFYGPNDSPDKGGKRGVCEFEELRKKSK